MDSSVNKFLINISKNRKVTKNCKTGQIITTILLQEKPVPNVTSFNKVPMIAQIYLDLIFSYFQTFLKRGQNIYFSFSTQSAKNFLHTTKKWCFQHSYEKLDLKVSKNIILASKLDYPSLIAIRLPSPIFRLGK